MARPPLALGAHGAIKVTEQAPGRHVARTRFRDADGATRRVEATGRTSNAALKALQDTLRSRRGAPGEELKPHTRFRVAGDAWMAKIVARRRGSTVDAYRRRLDGVIKPALGELQLRECTVGRLDMFMTSLEQRGFSANYRSAIRGVVRDVLQLAVQHEVLAANPVDALDNIDGDRTPPRALTVTERRTVLGWLDGPPDDAGPPADPDELFTRKAQAAARRRGVGDLIRFMLWTGARIGEACAVRWRDIDFDGVPVVDEYDQLRAVPAVNLGPVIVRITGRGLVRFDEGKTASAARTVALPQCAVDMLHARRPDRVDPNEPVFAVGGRRGPSWLDPAQGGKYISEVFTAAGLGWATSHVCRKTYLTILDDEQNLSARMKADVMGHATLLRDTYVGRGEFHPQVADVIGAAFREN